VISRAFLFTVIVLIGAGVGAAYLVSGPSPSVLALCAFGAVPVLALFALVVGLSYGVTLIRGSQAPAGQRADLFPILASVMREYFAHIIMFLVMAPFERIWLRDGIARDTRRTDAPVLLVHGYLLNGAAWWWFARLLEKEGFRAHMVSLTPSLGSIDAMAGSLERRIEAVCVASGAPRVHLVSHSMGGLVCRAYLRACGGARVASLVTIAGPHHGTVLARLGIGEAARAMVPESGWLAALADAERQAEHPPTVALWSLYDNYIAPQESAMLPWARNALLPPMGHVEMYFSRTLAARVCKELQARSA
jgi:pimeloyl-ACP methyl ester carboxylesterase